MSGTHERGGEHADEAAEELFDAYLDGALAGELEDPEEFSRRHGGLHADLRRRIEVFHRLAIGKATPRTRTATRMRPPSTDGLPFERLGDFRLLRPLGGGGMGLVYLAEQEPLGRLVALKLIRPELQARARARARFRREAEALARLRHPNIVTVLAVGEERGVLYLAMELAPGRGLNEIQAEIASGETTVPLTESVRWIADVARALHHAHGQGFVHRDVKPSNIRIGPDGRPLLLDFGLARDLEGSGGTQSGDFVGSPAYAAPEQLRGLEDHGDGSGDVYALGVTLYQTLVGRTPFEGQTVEEVLEKILHTEPDFPPDLAVPVPRDLELVAKTAMEKDPRRRYPTALAFAEDLEAVLELRPIRARAPGVLRRARELVRRRPAGAATAVTALIALAVLVILFTLQERSTRSEARADASAMVARARGGLEAFETALADTGEQERVIASLNRELEGRFLEPEEDRLLDRMEDSVEDVRRERERIFHSSLDLLERAQHLDPDVAGVDELRAELHLVRWRAARIEGDTAAEAFHREKVELVDRTGLHQEELQGVRRLVLASDPPGAEFRLFRCESLARHVPGAEPRRVHVPLDGWPADVAPDAWALRVLVGAGTLAAEDLILSVAGHPIRDTLLVVETEGPVRRGARLVSVDGEPVRDLFQLAGLEAEPAPPGGRAYRFGSARGEETLLHGETVAALGLHLDDAAGLAEEGAVRARVFRSGASQPGLSQELLLPVGLSVRPTAAPLYRLASSGTNEHELERGSYLVVARLAGHEERRSLIKDGTQTLLEPTLRLDPLGTTPPGFVPVHVLSSPSGVFRIQEREVTSAEYLAFLNDLIDRGEDATRHAPRNATSPAAGGHWSRNTSGRYELPEGWHGDWPAFGVSFVDASAYAAWRTERARASGSRARFSLPGYDQWVDAAANLPFVWGERFRPKWTKSNYARPVPVPERGCSFPIDESSFGVYDLAGSLSEWIDSPWGANERMRCLGGGSWAFANPRFFRTYPGNGNEIDFTMDSFGFRLVVTPEDEAP